MYNKAVIIIGAGGSLGKKISEAFIKMKVSLILIDKEPLIKKYESLSNKVITFIENIEDSETLSKVLLKGTEELGQGIGYLIYAAGIMSYGNVIEETIDTYEKVYRENTLYPVMAARCVIPYMKAEGFGHIILISSVFSMMYVPHMSAYSMSKAALNTFMKILSLENRQYNIKVNCIAPGLMKGSFSNDFLEKMLKNQNFIDSFTRLNNPFVKQKDIINIILSLVESSNINGEIICIDNGYSLH